MQEMMFSGDIMSLVVKVIFAVAGLFCVWALTRLSANLKIQAESAQATELDKLIYHLVAAAEQTLKEVDPNGTLRKKYVVDLLEELGFKVSQEINARIEAAVYDLNLEQNEIAG